MKSHLTASALALAGILLSATAVFADDSTEARKVLDFCNAHPANCSISINHISDGWKVDYNGRRLNVTASIIKLVHLIAYGEAVHEGRLDPSEPVNRDSWARFWLGQDGGALWNAYARFSQGKLAPPLTVTLDQMVSAMLRESDNATADYLLARLGRPAMADVIKRYMASGELRPGYVDVPKSIGATFESWLVNPDEPASGHRNIGDFSGFESWGYRKELDGLFAKLEQAGAIQRVRHFNCSWLPWEPPLTGCIPGVAIVEQDYRTLETGYFMHSNTHTYTQLMTGLLYRDLLPPGVQKVIEPYLEWRLTLPQYSGFLRYGAKSGSLGTGAGVTILTRTSYAENRNRVKAAVTIQLQGVENGQLLDLASLSAGVSHFVDALVNDPVFAFEAHARLDPKGKAVNEPSLIARVVHLTASNDHLAIVVKVTNIGGAESLRPAAIRGIILDKRPGPGARFVTGQQREVRRLDPGESQTVEFHLGGPVIGNFLAVAVVPDILKELPGNPVTWQYERIRATVK